MGIFKKFIYSVSLLSGTIIGVGFFSLPYITSKVGLPLMLLYFFILGTLVIIIHLFYGEIVLRTPDFLRFPGYAEIYLGKTGRKIAFLAVILGIFGALLAYLIVGGQFLTKLLSPIFGGNNLTWTFFYFSLGTILIFFGIKPITKTELLGLILFFLILILIFFQGLPYLKIKHLFPEINLSWFFLPYGPILFSLWGAALIPEVEVVLEKEKRLLKKVIPLSILIPIFIYLFFIFIILGVTGSQVSETALVGLENFLGKQIVNLGLFLGLLTTFTSFIAIGLVLRNIFLYDLKFSKNLAWLITCFIPLFLFLTNIGDFISVIGFVGGVMLGIEGILIILMYQKIKAKSKIKFLTYPLILIFLLGIIYQIIYFF